MNWFVYIVKCADETYYTGITTNIEKRISTHNNGKGAKYTARRGPVKLVYQESAETRSDASKREYAIKRLSRIQKIALIKSGLSASIKDKFK